MRLEFKRQSGWIIILSLNFSIFFVSPHNLLLEPKQTPTVAGRYFAPGNSISLKLLVVKFEFPVRYNYLKWKTSRAVEGLEVHACSGSFRDLGALDAGLAGFSGILEEIFKSRMLGIFLS
jgi:hypothetical protein